MSAAELDRLAAAADGLLRRLEQGPLASRLGASGPVPIQQPGTEPSVGKPVRPPGSEDRTGPANAYLPRETAAPSAVDRPPDYSADLRRLRGPSRPSQVPAPGIFARVRQQALSALSWAKRRIGWR